MVLIIKHYNLGTGLGQALAGLFSCRDRFGCGSSERWSPREIRSRLGIGRGGAVVGEAALKGVGRSDALLTEYLEVARLGTSLHKAQRGTAEAWGRGFFSF